MMVPLRGCEFRPLAAGAIYCALQNLNLTHMAEVGQAEIASINPSSAQRISRPA
jgi:hypothetical protein